MSDALREVWGLTEQMKPEDSLKNWKNDDAKGYAEKLIEEYGQPDEVTETMIKWNKLGSFGEGEMETYVLDESIPHDFPAPHRDYVYTTMNIKVDSDMLDTLGHVTGSIIYDGLKETVTARCGSLYANAATMGFVKDMVDGKVPVEDDAAKKEYADRIQKDPLPKFYDNRMNEGVEYMCGHYLDEAFSKKEIKMAIGVASDKRYAGGNMTGAVKAIEKIKKGLSDHPQVSAVLKRQNEDIEEELGEGKMKELAMKIADVYTKMKKDKQMKPFADKFKADVKTSLNIKKSLEKVLPDYIAGKEISKLMSEEVELDERKFEAGKSASGYDIFHKDFSSAMQHATAFAKSKGQPIKKDEIDNKVATGPRKPSKGKENSYTLETEKGKMWSVQVYNMGSKFELNMYLTSSHVPEGEELDEGTWAVPETPAQKRDLKKLLSKPLPLGKEGDNAADKMYSIIGDDELFDALYVAGKESPESDARPIIKKAMKRLKIKEDRWFDRDSWRLDESTKPDHIKIFNSLKKGDKVEINYDSSIAGGTTKTFVIKTKNKVYKGKVDKVTMYPDGKTGGVKFHLYQYDNRPGVYMAIGDMGASMRDIKKL